MNRGMRPLLISLVLAAAFALPLAAFATDAPSPTVVSACQAEAAQLGKDAFSAKYGPTEPFGHCYAAHAATTTTTVPGEPTSQKQPLPNAEDAARTVAYALCSAGRKPVARCIGAARQIVATCRASSGTSRDAFKACVLAALPKRS
jgi:hypothetical protein